MSELCIESSGVYKITCVQNGKFYIGSTISFRKRFKSHSWALKRGTHVNHHLQRAYDKYGENSFKFEPLLVCDRQDLLAYEQICLDLYGTYEYEKGYNICKIAGNTLGMKATEEVKEKMRKARVGFRHSEESKEKMSLVKSMKRKPLSEYHKQQVSLSKKGKKRTWDIWKNRQTKETG